MGDETLEQSGRRILLIEDEWLVADKTVKALRALGCEVEGPVADFDTALRLCANAEFDAALLDINLKGVMAYALADRLAARGAPFAFVTGYAASALPSRYGAAPVFEKPADIPAIVRRLLKA